MPAGSAPRSPLAALGWGAASLATAAISHGLIDRVGSLLGAASDDDAYAGRAHIAVAPVLVALVLVGLLLFARLAVEGAARRERLDGLLIVVRCFGRVPPLRSIFAVAAGGFSVLMTMEFIEQIQSYGAIAGVADALGGNAAIGLSILLCATCAVTLTGVRLAAAFLAAVAAVRNFVLLFSRQAKERATGLVAAIGIPRRAASPSVLLPSARGMRAPPAAV